MSRTRTPPAEKWLLNELAAARGDLESLELELEMTRAATVRFELRLGQQQAVCRSLEKVLEMTLGEAHRAWTRQVGPRRPYGGRGSLRQWLREAIQEAYPHPLDSMTLLEMAIPVFGLVFVSKAARNLYYDNTFRRQLFALMEQGSVERLTLTGRGSARTCWRWKAPADLSAVRAHTDLAEVG